MFGGIQAGIHVTCPQFKLNYPTKTVPPLACELLKNHMRHHIPRDPNTFFADQDRCERTTKHVLRLGF